MDEYQDDILKELHDNAPLGESIAKGEAVVCIPDMASSDECLTLFAAALRACEGRGPADRGRNRFSVSDPQAFSNDVVLLCDKILLRVSD